MNLHSGLLPGMSVDLTKQRLLKHPESLSLSVHIRTIKENKADWHNLILKWKSLSDSGFNTMSNIANLKINLFSKDKIGLENSSLTSNKKEEKTSRTC